MQRSGWKIVIAFRRGIALGISVAILSSETFAQITPDNSLGAESSILTPNVNVQGDLADLIGGGAIRDVNLFHSFSDFNVGDLQRVYFANPTGIENIFSRITGGNISNILGTLGVDGNTNLFFINPNGIVFGENAFLDVSGSFFATTAESFVFGDHGEFSAINSNEPPLLTLSISPGLQWGTNNSQQALNRGNLTVGQDLTLAAGNLDLQGQIVAGHDLNFYATDTITIRDSVTEPFIALAGNELEIQGDNFIDIFVLNHSDSGLFSGEDMVLRSANSVRGDAHFFAGGNFRIEQLDGSLGILSSPHDPVIRATGDVNFESYEGASLHIFAGGSVTIPGRITITGIDTVGNSIQEEVTFSNGTVINVNGNLQPTLDIRAGVDFDAVGGSFVTVGETDGFNPTPTNSFTASSADIRLGAVVVNAADGLILLTNQYEPNITLSSETIEIVGIFTNDSLFTGDASDVIIDSRSNLSINNGTIFTNSATGERWRYNFHR